MKTPRAFLLMLCEAETVSAWPFRKERPPSLSLLRPHLQEKCSGDLCLPSAIATLPGMDAATASERPHERARPLRLAERCAEWLLLLICCAFLFAHTLPSTWKTLNTDFPNYYLAAQLQRQGIDTARAYEWQWLARQKDHHDIDRPLLGLVPITPFSILAVSPLTGLPPLAAKRVWTLLQLALLLPIALALRRISGEPWRRIALLIVACFPLHRNLEYGQYYILLLALMVAACWAYQRQRSALAGALIALAAAAKVFPVLFLLYFLRKRDWRALIAALLTGAAAALVSIACFGWSMHRTYLNLVLPWTLRGEVLPPYTLASGSISTLLHRLFLYEPQWNPHPWHASPTLFAILQPLLQMLVLAPALLLVAPAPATPRRIALEWSALLTAALAISTSPASYNFTLLIFPIVVLYGYLRPRHRAAALAVLLLFFAIGYPGWNTANTDGLRAALHLPRLYLLLLFTGALYAALLHQYPRPAAHLSSPRRATLRWAAALATLCLFSILSGLRHQRGLYADYAYRIPQSNDLFIASAPSPGPAQTSVARVAMLPQGFAVLGLPAVPRTVNDQLSFAANSTAIWVEQAAHTSRLVPLDQPDIAAIDGAQSPALSADGAQLAYLRETRGRTRLYLRPIAAGQAAEVPWTPSSMNVEEAAFLPDASLIVAAAAARGGSQLYHFSAPLQATALNLGEARYPAASPDGHWLAYSVFASGSWNLWLLDRLTGTRRRITDAACNQIEPAWEADSKTLLYASDCGRALWFTALCRRRIIP
jgi:Glycosyltransferase family 87/WD40-like Beta Propeller Repeat